LDDPKMALANPPNMGDPVLELIGASRTKRLDSRRPLANTPAM
jgi:hypothetical protein